MVDFLEGDPDRPIIVGRVYNSAQGTPFTLPQDKEVGGVKTRSVGGPDEEFNGLAFVDRRGGEHVHLRSQRDLLVDARRDQAVVVPRDYTMHTGVTHATVVGCFGTGGEDRVPWESVAVPGAFGSKVETVIGSTTSLVFGLGQTQFAIPGATLSVFDPLALLAQLPAVGALFDLLDVGGYTRTVWGPDTEMIYLGPRWNFRRGMVYEMTGPVESWNRAVASFDTLTAAITVLSYLFTLRKKTGFHVGLLAANGIHTLTMFIVGKLEQKFARARALKNTAAISFGLTLQGLQMSRGIRAGVEDGDKALYRAYKDFLAEKKGTYTLSIPECYTLHGGRINLTSDSEPINLVSGTGTILIDATEKEVMIASGRAGVVVSNKQKLLQLENTGVGSEVKILYAERPGAPLAVRNTSFLKLDHEGLWLERIAGADDSNVVNVAAGKVELLAAYDEAAGEAKASVAVSEDGIELQVGENVFKVTKDGFEFNGGALKLDLLRRYELLAAAAGHASG